LHRGPDCALVVQADVARPARVVDDSGRSVGRRVRELGCTNHDKKADAGNWRRSIAMQKDAFDKLVESVKEMKAIQAGKQQPARVTRSEDLAQFVTLQPEAAYRSVRKVKS
jgi:hypothetical protein